MKIKLICVGKNNHDFVEIGVAEYSKRLKKYISFEIIYTKSWKITKSVDSKVVKAHEAEAIQKYIQKNDVVILLDDKGEMYNSISFSAYVQNLILQNRNDIIFVIGGALGFGDELYKRSNALLSMSKMTFPHHLIRVMFTEQLYRAFSIVNNEPYHNE